MIFEKIDFKFDIVQLQNTVVDIERKFQPANQNDNFNGWSVLSSNGSYLDGWQKAHYLLDPKINPSEKNNMREALVKNFSEYTIETEICKDYLAEVIKQVRHLNLNPYRARIICLNAGAESVWHVDEKADNYCVRLHIPIKTNVGCVFETESQSDHMAADGSGYFVYVNRLHRVVNRGTDKRYHLVMNVLDQKGLTQYHSTDYFQNTVKQK